MYVDDLISGRHEFEIIKQKLIELFRKGGFNLDWWQHSNIPSL